MAVTAFGSGTQAATINTEHFLANVNESGVYTLHVDAVNMAAGDVLEVRLYQIVLTGGTARQVSLTTYYGVQDDPVKVSMPISNELTDTNALRFSIKQTNGTGRNFPWKVLKHA